MTLRQIHQFHPSVSYGDATSNQMLSLQHLLRRMGYKSELFCYQLPIHFNGKVRQINRYTSFSDPDNLLLLHFSLSYASEIFAWLSQIPDRKVIVYHNITPYHYFDGINDRFYEAAQEGREQFEQLRILTEAGWGDSAFNCQELAEYGWSKLEVLPIIFDKERYDIRPERKLVKRFQGGVNILFVGRVSPNKCFEDLILTFYYLKCFVQPEARLLLVGATGGMEPYLEFLQTLVNRLGLSDIIFTGHVSSAQLMALYRSANVFLSMSEHEGFGVPLLESMYFGLPIVAYKSSAVPETLGGSGLLVTKKDYRAIAELIGLLLEDEKMRERVINRQRKRLPAFFPEQIEVKLRTLLHNLGV